MAFKNLDLSVIAFANGFTLWHYSTKDSSEEVLKPGYFNPTKHLVENGDIFILTMSGETVMKMAKIVEKTLHLEPLRS